MSPDTIKESYLAAVWRLDEAAKEALRASHDTTILPEINRAALRDVLTMTGQLRAGGLQSGVEK